MHLTKELIARTFKTFPEPSAEDRAAMPLLTPDEIAASRLAFLDGIRPNEDVWLFAYGSLMWRPEMEFAEQRNARLLGWHRRFCIWQWRWRGTKAKPGLMMALDRGGSCIGIAYRISAPAVSSKLAKVWEREMIGKAYQPR